MKFKIPYTNFKKSISQYKPELIKAFDKCLESGRYILGPEVKKFEKKFANYCNTQYAIGVASGTCALHLAVRVLGIGKGDEVITAPNSFIASATSVEINGAKVIFADIDDDLNINPIEIEKKLTKKTRAIMPVHLTGRPAKMDQIKKISREHNLYIIEDAAQAIGSMYKNKKIGSFGDIACFSLHPLKNLHAFGDSGMLVTNKKKYSNELSITRNLGLKNRDDCSRLGFNCRLDELQASLLNIEINQLTNRTKKRREVAFKLNSLLSDIVDVPSENLDEFHVYQTYVIIANNRDELSRYLRSKGIETLIHYPVPLYRQTYFKNRTFNLRNFKKTEYYKDKILSLPIYPEMSDNEIDFMTSEIRNFYK